MGALISAGQQIIHTDETINTYVRKDVHVVKVFYRMFHEKNESTTMIRAGRFFQTTQEIVEERLLGRNMVCCFYSSGGSHVIECIGAV